MKLLDLTGGTMRRYILCLLIAGGLFGGTAHAQRQERIQPADVYVRTARIAIKDKDFKRAEKNLAICLENYPEDYQAHYLMGAIWAEKDQIDSMVTEFNLVRRYAGKKLKKIEKTMLNIEDDKWEQGFNGGVEWINTADSLNNEAGETEDMAEGQKLRGMVEKSLDESARYFRNCTLIKPNEFRGWFNRGLVFDRKRDYVQAAEMYKKSESMFHLFSLNDSITVFYDTTLFYQGEGEITPLFAEIIKKFKKIKEDFRIRYKGLITALGGVYFELEEFENCIFVFRRLLGFYEEDLNALEYVGSSFQQLGFNDEALKWTGMILEQNPDDKDRLFNVGVHWYNDGVEAKKKYENLLREKLQGSKDTNIQVEINKAEERYRRDFVLTLEMLDQVLVLNPEDKESWKLKGVSIFFLERYDEAIPVLEKVREMFPDDQAICQMLRECFRSKGDMEAVLRLTEECGI